MRKYNDDGLISCFAAILILILSAAINGFTFPYTINTWLVYFHKAPVIQWWQGVLIGFVPTLGQLTIVLAVVTWIIMLFL